MILGPFLLAAALAVPSPTVPAARPGRRLSVETVPTGSVVTPLGYNIKVNSGSTLERTCYAINDPAAPASLNGALVGTYYESKQYGGDYQFRSSGTITFSGDARAFEVVHVLFNVFGERLKALSSTEVTDIAAGAPQALKATWRAWENEVSEYLTCISYVRSARRADGTVWRANMDAVFSEFARILPNLTKESVEPEKPRHEGKGEK